MTRLVVSGLYRLAWTCCALVTTLPSALLAQEVAAGDSSTTLHAIPGEMVNALPVDRPADVLALEPGVTTTNDGNLMIRGSNVGDAALYLDGIPILSGFRSTPFFALSRAQTLESQLGLSPNMVGSLAVQTGPLSAAAGNGQAGAIYLRSREAGQGLEGGLSYETDEPFGAGASVGLNRLAGNLSASLLPGLSLIAGGLVQGQRSVGSGLDGDQAPIFVRAGIDTTVAVPSAPGDPFSDTTFVDVQDYAVSRGNCEAFAGSANPGIAANYGLSCQGIQTPQSPVSTYQLLGKLTYALGTRGRLTLLGLAHQQQNRNFEYGTLYNAAGVTGNRATSGLVGLSWRHILMPASDRPLVLNASLSSQWDRERSGPLTLDEVQSTADLSGGFLLRPLDLRFDFDNFPVDDELLQNYRTNEAGSRRSPYELENVNQYALIDRYRNNAYGLYNRDFIAPTVFPESGGPLGFLTLYKEQRTVATVGLSWQVSRINRLQVGGEAARYSVANYSHFLESSLFSDVYLEKPIRSSFFIQDQVQLGPAVVTGGVRYDAYNTRARRPADFPRISSHPSYDPANPDAFFTSDTFFPEDDSHSRLSPHIQASFAVSPTTTVRGGYAQQAQVPDFRRLLVSINTDFSLTSPDQVFGQDLDFERSYIYELGARHALSADWALDVALYSKTIQSDIGLHRVGRFDPLNVTTRLIYVLANSGTGKVRGVDLKLERTWGRSVSGWIGYSYQDAKGDLASGILGGGTVSVPLVNSRPHSVAGALAVTLPQDWRQGSTIGAVLRNVGLFTTFRFTSGTAYTRCTSGADVSTLSPQLCVDAFTEPINGERLPAFKQLDLRLTKSFGPGHRLTGYVDARNLLNFENVLAVFATTGETSNPREQQMNWSADSADYANEAQASGAFQPDGSIDLGVGQADPRAGCGAWVNQAGDPAAPNCVYLIGAEERFGNGDHRFDLTEQRRASDALYTAVRGQQELTGPGRRIRLGLEASF